MSRTIMISAARKKEELGKVWIWKTPKASEQSRWRWLTVELYDNLDFARFRERGEGIPFQRKKKSVGKSGSVVPEIPLVYVSG